MIISWIPCCLKSSLRCLEKFRMFLHPRCCGSGLAKLHSKHSIENRWWLARSLAVREVVVLLIPAVGRMHASVLSVAFHPRKRNVYPDTRTWTCCTRLKSSSGDRTKSKPAACHSEESSLYLCFQLKHFGLQNIRSNQSIFRERMCVCELVSEEMQGRK